jgi:hypothetical protein
MSNVARLNTFLGSRGISHETLRMSFNVSEKDITEETAPDIEARVSESISVKFDEDEFAKIARMHGMDEATIDFLASIESAPGVLDLY